MNYESPYDFEILNDLHNLFPELLYDSQLFPTDTNRVVGWMRYRMMNMFPQTYRQTRQAYDLNRAAGRRADHDDWAFITSQTNPPSTPPPRRLHERTVPTWTPSPVHSIIQNLLGAPSPAEWGGSPTTLQYRYATPSQPSTPSLNYIIPPLHVNTGLNALLQTFFDSVVVNASEEEITAASTLINGSEIAQEVICPVCQDHEQGSPPADSSWRKLNGCSHLFHRSCVDSWFARNAHCPVCRADIRVAQRPVTEGTMES